MTEPQSSGWLREQHPHPALVDIKAGVWLWSSSRCHEGPMESMTVALVPLLLRSQISKKKARQFSGAAAYLGDVGKCVVFGVVIMIGREEISGRECLEE